jgi:phosphoribosylanthranilate isomerase
MTRVKICGITNGEDALAAIRLGAHALGFIFVPDTPRFIGDGDRFERLAEGLPPFVGRVGVCAEPAQIPGERMRRLTAIQFYSDGTDAGTEAHPDRIQAFRISDAASLAQVDAALARGRPSAIFLDAFRKDKLGGSGETFDWDIAVEARRRFSLPLILAGGLTPDNVEEAVERVRPFAVDVSSGVEAEPGRKDHARLKAFIDAVHRADERFVKGALGA